MGFIRYPGLSYSKQIGYGYSAVYLFPVLIMSLFKYIIIRIALVAAFLFAANKVYVLLFWKADISAHAPLLENIMELDPEADAIYFGESSNFHTPKPRTSLVRISNLIDDLLPRIQIYTLDHAGVHAGTYYSLIKNISEESRVRFFIITLNLRSFGADWRYSKGENYLLKTSRMLEPNLPVLNKFFISLKHYDYRTDEERNRQLKHAWRTEKFTIPHFEYDNVIQWDSAMAWHTWLHENPRLTKENIPLACHYIKNFAFAIDTLTNERIRDFDKIMEWTAKRNIKVILNLMGENVEEAQKLAGRELFYLFEKNRNLLIERYERKGALVVDNLYSIPDSCFVDRNWPTEHYNLQGKKIIAARVRDKILEFFETEQTRTPHICKNPDDLVSDPL